jgi:superfamily II RNA helicase
MTEFLHTPDAMTAPAAWPPAEGLALDNGYEPDPFQKHAILGIHAGDHVFVTAKTGSGKTFVGEFLIARALAKGQRVFYTTPIKSLSNQKYHDLKKLFPTATVGILTGDIKVCPDAQIVVMTAEILRNLFYKRGTATESVGLTATVSLEGVAGIIMDETHYIQDPDRGHVWEETMILCPRFAQISGAETTVPLQLVLLSATMPSAASLAGWLGNLHQRRVWLLNTTYRVVPLEHAVLRATSSDGPASLEVSVFLNAVNQWSPDAYTGWLRDREATADAADEHKRRVTAAKGSGGAAKGGAGAGYWSRAEHDKDHDAKSAALRAAKVRVLSPIARLRRTIAWLQETNNLPALFFMFSRKECERLADQMEGSFLDSSETAAVTHIVDFHLSRHRTALEKSPQFHQIRDLLKRGVAFHHSGLMPLLKEIVEIVYTRGLVRLLFATETFAVGLNMPTKTVVFLDLSKFSDGGVSSSGAGGNTTSHAYGMRGSEKRLLRPDEYIQMAGRAGRRGKDTRGLVLYEPLREPVTALELRSIVSGSLPALESRMRFHYEFILRRSLMPGASRSIVDESYWALQQREARVELGKSLAEKEATLATIAFNDEEATAFTELDSLTTAVESAKGNSWKRATAALKAWKDEYSKPKWAGATRRFEQRRVLRAEVATLSKQIADWDAAPLLNVGSQEQCLREWGFLAPVSTGGKLVIPSETREGFLPAAAEEPVPLLGQMASEVAEGHCILMPLLAMSDKTKDLTAEEIACLLAGFLSEGGGPKDREPTLADTGLRREALDILYWVDDRTNALMDTEERAGVSSPADFWRLSALWVAVTARWISGSGLTDIAAEFGLFEGNVQRGLLRVANILEEWTTVCELRRDLAGLEKIRAFRFLRDEIVTDSLYLRL